MYIYICKRTLYVLFDQWPRVVSYSLLLTPYSLFLTLQVLKVFYNFETFNTFKEAQSFQNF